MTDTQPDQDPFADIRPYTNAEAPAVFARLVRDPEFIDALSRLRLPRMVRLLPWLAHALVTRWLRRQQQALRTVEDLQQLIEPQLAQVIERTARFTTSGLERLGRDESWLFISNHRDIVMDPALTNFALHQSGHRTCNIAIGSNLLRKPWVADLMRLNKSFIVQRDVSGPRELLAASKRLSGYIRHVIATNASPAWIAQREGRAKDGRDLTEPAVIKMLSLSRDRKAESVGETLASLRIVPVSIAYELDPCDVRKARELAAGSDYQKAEFEDVASIGEGITGYKGSVHLAFGEPILDPSLAVDDVVAEIDRQVIGNYALFPTNLWAWEMRAGRAAPSHLTVQPGVVERTEFERRVNDCPEALRDHLIAMYANPVEAALAASPEAPALAG